MNFKHWKDADKRIDEIKTDVDAIVAEIAADKTAARNEELEVEQRDELINLIQTKVEKRDRLQKEYDETVKIRDELRAAEERQFGMLENLKAKRIVNRLGGEESGKDLFATRSYALAWAEYIRTGNDAEVRGLISTTDSNSGGVLVPTTLVEKIEDTLRTGGRIMALCSITSVKGITEHPVAKSRTNPAWHAEGGAAKPKKTVQLTSVAMEPQFISEILETTRKFESDSVSAFWEWINAELPDALRRVIDREILWGAQSGSNGIRGILTNTDPLFVQTLPAHALSFNSTNEAVSMLADGAEINAAIAMNKKTFLKNVMGLQGADGHPIYKIAADSNTNKPSYFMGGYPLVFTSDLPDYDTAAAGDVYMVVGDFAAMKLNFPNGMAPNLIRDEISRKADNVIEYLSEIYVGGNIVRPENFVKVTKAS